MKLISLIITVLFANIFVSAQEEEGLGWPREIEKKGYTVIFYQPQLESFQEDILEGRMAISVKNKDGQPIFGAAWFKTRVDTDFDTRMVSFEDLEFTDTKFPDIDEENYKGLKDLVMKEIGKWDLEMSLDRFLVSLDGIQKQQEGLDDSMYDNSPPDIYYREEPAVLVLVDGGPTLKPTDESNLMSVINTPYYLVFDTKKNMYYLNGAKWWFESEKVEEGWKEIKNPPKNVKNHNEKIKKGEDTELDSVAREMKDPPEIIVSTKPAELISSNGKADFKPVEGTNLLFMSNTESDVLMDINTQQYYILISGRWFKSGSLNGNDWTFVNPYTLPEDFQNIPENSPIASIRASIPETQESKEAILENSIPQTAEIDRNSAVLMVKYDGDPKFEKIEGTDVYYSLNTDKDVLMFEKTYYCVDEAVWFVAPSPTGPWKVCDYVPDEIYDIPANSPVHNVTYVYIYESTPEVVYVGYTPGYYGSYVSYGTVVYGTGYYYHPWYGAYYYPRPVTYGYGVHYNPYTGWGFSVGVSYGWVHYGNPYYHAYWGPAGYRYGYRYGYGYGHHYGYRPPNSITRRPGYSPGYRGRPTTYSASNAYKNRTTGVRSTGGRPVTTPSNRVGETPRRSNQPNNVYSDRNGNTYRRQENGSWQQRDNRSGQWQNRDGVPSTRPGAGAADRNPATRPSTGVTDRTQGQGARPSTGVTNQSRPSTQPNMNNDYNSRNRGATRSSNYNQTYQRSGSPAPSRTGGGARPAGSGTRRRN